MEGEVFGEDEQEVEEVGEVGTERYQIEGAGGVEVKMGRLKEVEEGRVRQRRGRQCNLEPHCFLEKVS